MVTSNRARRIIEDPVLWRLSRLRDSRDSFGTPAALFGVNPWRLQRWMGRKQIEETMLYVHVADNHRREIAEGILAAGAGETDPEARIITMLGARGSHVAADSDAKNGKAVTPAA
jgi:hypothetical protein